MSPPPPLYKLTHVENILKNYLLETNIHLYLSKMDEIFIAIKFEVIGVNFVACVSCQNGSGSLWLKLIGLSQSRSWIKARLSCNQIWFCRSEVISREENWLCNDCLRLTEGCHRWVHRGHGGLTRPPMVQMSRMPGMSTLTDTCHWPSHMQTTLCNSQN